MHRKLPIYERTFVIIKPEAVQRGLIGEIISRFEKKGLKIVAMKMLWASKETVLQHYDWPEEDRLLLGNRTKESMEKRGVKDDRDPLAIAEWVQGMLIDHLTTSPSVAMVVEGAHAVENVRKLRGKTNPLESDIGTITGDYTIDSYQLADVTSRAVRTIVHASGSTEEAKREIALWFEDGEILDYDLVIEKLLYSKEWEELNKKYNPNKDRE